MRLLVHNFLACTAKGVTKGYPLGLEVTSSTTVEVPFNPDFLRHILPRIEWKGFVEAAAKLGVQDLPEAVDPDTVDEEFLRKLHHALLEVELVEGALVCPETQRRFPVSKGIANMLLHEDEV